MNETIVNSTLDLGSQFITWVNQNGGKIPISVIQETQSNWTQFSISLAITLLGSMFVFYFLYQGIKPSISTFIIKRALDSIKQKTGRNILFIKHTQGGLFDASMINQQTMLELNKALQKFNGAPFDLVLHTPGGEIFSAMFISRVIATYPNKVNVIVPFYAMSGGTLLALAGSNIYMSPMACLGPVDPQLGSLFKFGSARSWDKILKYKGKKADDQSISFAFMGQQYTKSIANYIDFLLQKKMLPDQRKKFVKFLTSGDVEHAYPLTITELNKFGLSVKPLDKSVTEKLNKVITSPLYEGVYHL